MSRENVEVSRQAFEAYRVGGIEAGLAFFAPDGVSYAFPERRDDPACRGHKGVRRIDAIWRQGFDNFVLEIHEIRDLDERVLLLCEMSGRAKDSGAHVRRPIAALSSDFRDGMIGETRFFPNWEEAFNAVASPR